MSRGLAVCRVYAYDSPICGGLACDRQTPVQSRIPAGQGGERRRVRCRGQNDAKIHLRKAQNGPPEALTNRDQRRIAPPRAAFIEICRSSSCGLLDPALTLWKKEERFDAEQLKPQAA